VSLLSLVRAKKAHSENTWIFINREKAKQWGGLEDDETALYYFYNHRFVCGISFHLLFMPQGFEL